MRLNKRDNWVIHLLQLYLNTKHDAFAIQMIHIQPRPVLNEHVSCSFINVECFHNNFIADNPIEKRGEKGEVWYIFNVEMMCKQAKYLLQTKLHTHW